MADLDVSGFWDTSTTAWVEPALTDDMLEQAERSLGVTLPALLVELLRAQNGGITGAAFDAFPTDRPTSWAPDHVPFDYLLGIPPRGASTALLENAYMLREWSIPDGFVLLSGDGHYWIALDYRLCGPAGEPSVWWLDTELDESVELAPSFEAFVRGLVSAELFEEEGE